MNNSHLLGLILFGVCALFALLTWVVSTTHPDIAQNPVQRRRTQFTALCFLLFGAAFGYAAFAIDNQMRITTLHETMVEGSLETTPNTPAPVRTISFTVDHPGVEHELYLSPTADLLHIPKSDAELTFSLEAPDGKSLLSERTESFRVRPATEDHRADWNGKTFPFTPSNAGIYTVHLTPITANIPRIQVRITDPLKRDGKRMPGY